MQRHAFVSPASVPAVFLMCRRSPTQCRPPQLDHVPADGVPLFDFDAPSGRARDTSAAAIVSSALVQLAAYQPAKAPECLAAAGDTLASLAAAPYLASPGASDAVLTHNGNDCGADGCTVIETDYYFYEALRRFKAATKTQHN